MFLYKQKIYIFFNLNNPQAVLKNETLLIQSRIEMILQNTCTVLVRCRFEAGEISHRNDGDPVSRPACTPFSPEPVGVGSYEGR